LQAQAGLTILAKEFISINSTDLMKNNLQLENEFSVSITVIKLAFVSGALLSCMYGVLMVFASAFKVLG
jgi:hypothetical protein